MPGHDLFISVTALTDRNATVAAAVLYDVDIPGDGLAMATGSSKREPGDVSDENIAVSLAVGRALQKLGRQLVSQANKKVSEAVELAEAQRARRNRSGLA